MDITMAFSIVFAIVGLGALIAAVAVDVSRGWAAEARRVAATNEALAQLRKQLAGALADAEGASAEVRELRKQLADADARSAWLRKELGVADEGARNWRSIAMSALDQRDSASKAAKAAKLRVKALSAQRAALRATIIEMENEAEFAAGQSAIIKMTADMEVQELQMEILNLILTTDRTHNF
jgi:hypothetical protein